METLNPTGVMEMPPISVPKIDPFRIYSIAEAAAIAGISRQTIYNATRKSGIAKLNSGIRRHNGTKGIKGKDLDTWLNSLY